VMPVSLLAVSHPALVHKALDGALIAEVPSDGAGRFVVPLWSDLPQGLDLREAAVAGRLTAGPVTLAEAVQARTEAPALGRLVTRGLVMIAALTPSDAAHALGLVDVWDTGAATKALTLFARRRSGKGERIARDAPELARRIVDQVTAQTVDCLLEAAFTEDGRGWTDAVALARHPLSRAGLDQHRGVVRMSLTLGVPVIGLGASAPAYYGAVGKRLGTRMVLPEHAGVANAIGAVVGQVAMVATGTVTSPGPGMFLVHLPEGPLRYQDQDQAMGALEAALTVEASARARASGVEEVRLSTTRDIRQVEVEGAPMFIEARLRVTAQGRPRIAAG
jgi:N-methylhydantoinase A/oxoprolinase/acetone carboxylase beta subunit